jgi:hypothetical protein
MGNFVLRVSHFLFHPFGPAATSRLSTPARAKPKMTLIPPTPASPSSCSDLAWMSLTEQEPHDPRDDLAWLSLEYDEREVEDPRDDLAWLSLEEVPHPALAKKSST